MQRSQLVWASQLLAAALSFLFLSVRSTKIADEGQDGISMLPAEQVKPATDWILPNPATGRRVELAAQAKHRPVVFSFWATWCGPCRMELPHLERVSQKYAGRVDFYGINSDDAASVLPRFARKIGLTFPQLSDGQRSAATSYGVESIPMMVVVDTHDNVRAVALGYDPDEDIERSLSQVLDTLLKQPVT